MPDLLKLFFLSFYFLFPPTVANGRVCVKLEILGTGRIVPRGGSLLDYVGYLHIFLKDVRDGKKKVRIWIIWYRYG